MDILEIGLKIIKKFNENNFEAYIVGGAVRDYLLGKEISDIDITTNALPEDVKSIFSNADMKGQEYLSCRIIESGIVFECTTFRKDISYSDHRHPMIVKASSLEEDLIRRDFTINALAMNYDKEIIDLFGGKDDLTRGVIKTIGFADTRFNEDGLRVLRCLEFASRFDFSLDAEIINSFKTDYLKYLPLEYIKQMLEKIILGKSKIGLRMIKDYNLLRSFPFYQTLAEDAYEFNVSENIYAMFLIRHKFLPLNMLIMNKEYKYAKEIAYLVDNNFSNISLYYGNKECITDAVNLYNKLIAEISPVEIERRYRELPIKSAKDIDFDITIIEERNRSNVIKMLEMAIINNTVENNKDSLMDYLRNEGKL